jgi:hypothetical protein
MLNWVVWVPNFGPAKPLENIAADLRGVLDC